MITYRIVPNDAGDLSVKMILDMKPYCEASRKMRDNEKLLRQACSAEVREPFNGEDVDIQNKPISDKIDSTIKAAYDKERDEVESMLFGALGETYWTEIKQALSAMSDPTNSNEMLLSRALKEELLLKPIMKSETNKPQSPVIQVLDKYFIELLKNSMDAMIKRYLHGLSSDTTLQVRILIPRPTSVDNLTLVITDNAGGFQDKYIASFTQFINEKRYINYTEQNLYLSDKGADNPDKKYYFGGCGQGMNLICTDMFNNMLAGQSSLMRISNNADLDGAEITFAAPLTYESTSSFDSALLHTLSPLPLSSPSSSGAPTPSLGSDSSLAPSPLSSSASLSVTSFGRFFSNSSVASNGSAHSNVEHKQKHKPSLLSLGLSNQIGLEGPVGHLRTLGL